MAEIWGSYIWPTTWIAIKVLAIVLPILISVAYLTYVERKVIGAIHLRKGPNVVGPFGLFQPLADGLKLFIKETSKFSERPKAPPIFFCYLSKILQTLRYEKLTRILNFSFKKHRIVNLARDVQIAKSHLAPPSFLKENLLLQND